MLASSAEYATHLMDPSKPAIKHAFKMPIWQYIAQAPQLGKQFSHDMNILSNISMQGIIHSIRLPETGILADVGAGQGTILLNSSRQTQT